MTLALSELSARSAHACPMSDYVKTPFESGQALMTARSSDRPRALRFRRFTNCRYRASPGVRSGSATRHKPRAGPSLLGMRSELVLSGVPYTLQKRLDPGASRAGPLSAEGIPLHRVVTDFRSHGRGAVVVNRSSTCGWRGSWPPKTRRRRVPLVGRLLLPRLRQVPSRKAERQQIG